MLAVKIEGGEKRTGMPAVTRIFGLFSSDMCAISTNNLSQKAIKECLKSSLSMKNRAPSITCLGEGTGWESYTSFHYLEQPLKVC